MLQSSLKTETSIQCDYHMRVPVGTRRRSQFMK